MRRALLLLLVATLAAAVCATGPADAGPPPGAEGCPVFPADNAWHADVSTLPVHAQSGAWILAMGGPARRLHPDFGPSGEATPYGIPYEVVDAAHAKVDFTFDYADESDPGPYPFGPDVPVEPGSDHHALMVDKDACRLYELYAVDAAAHHAGSGAVFDLRSNALRPAGWTSADAAGLPVFAGLLRRDEVLAGDVDHAVRVTASRTSRAYLWPARHYASVNPDPSLPPMGAWFRMKAGYDVSRFSPTTQVILRAFKKHGLIVADNGSDWFFTGSADDGWESSVMDELKSITADAFEAVDASSLMVSPDSGQARQPSAPPSTTTTTTARPPVTLPPTVTVPPAVTVPPEVTVTTPLTVEAAPPAPASASLAGNVTEQPARPPHGRRLGWWTALALAVAVGGLAATSARGRRPRRRP
jgi:hypothetical protein